MRVIARICVVLFASLIFALSIHAQTDELIAYRSGDLVTWSLSNNVPEQITSWGYNGGGLLSPDGSMIAFSSYDGTVGEKIANGEIFPEFGNLPANIWVMDVATREFQWINDQSGAVRDGIYRSHPVWSPEGTQLAWVELIDFPIVAIQIYDFATGTITPITNSFDMGFQDAGIWIPEIKWGGGGISRILFNLVGDDFTGQNILEIYDPQTGEKIDVDLTFLDPEGSASLSHHWLETDEGARIALQVDNRWGLIDPQDGSYAPLNSPPVLQKVGDSSVQLIPVYTGSYSYEWYVNNNGIVTALDYNTFSIESAELPTISPDGSVVAWHNRGGIYIWDTGSRRTQKIIESSEEKSYETPAPINVVWSPMEWVLSDAPIVIEVRPTDSPTIVPPTQAPQPTAVPQQTNNCKTPARLNTNSYAVLSPGENNNVRQSWSIGSSILGEIYPGEVVYVMDGPVCAEGYNWYLVSNEYVYGWTAEGFGGAYWLIPWN